MRGCELLWDAEKAKKVHGWMEEAVGAACMNVPGFVCPALPKRLAVIPQGAQKVSQEIVREFGLNNDPAQ